MVDKDATGDSPGATVNFHHRLRFTSSTHYHHSTIAATNYCDVGTLPFLFYSLMGIS
jgi:hypothetical protein